MLPGISEDYSIVVKQYGELKGLLGTEEVKRKLWINLSESEFIAQRIMSSLEAIRYRLDLSSSFYLSGSKDTDSSEDKESLPYRLASLGSTIQKIEDAKKRIEATYAKIRNDFKNISNKLDSLQKSKYTENIFYAMRALSLGALGALVTLIATGIIGIQKKGVTSSLFELPNFWSLLTSHAFLGAIVSVVIFGLFYTKQLTIFQPENMSKDNHMVPEFWRVTMLCILAGAFAEKLYNAASTKIDDYVVDDDSKRI